MMISSFGFTNINTSKGFSISNELLYSLSKRFSTSVDFSLSNAYNGVHNVSYWYEHDLSNVNGWKETHHQTLYSLGALGYFSPINNSKNFLGIGAGLSLNYQIDTYNWLNGLNTEPSITVGNVNYFGLGYNVSIKYLHEFSESISLGVKGNLVFFDDQCSSLLLSFGYKLHK